MGSPFSQYSGPLTQGKRLYQRDVIGAGLGLANVGDIWYVDATNGSDTTYVKNDPKKALATVGAAYTAATANQDDVVCILHGGGSGRTTETTAITWAKRYTHLIGATGPLAQDARAGISFGTGGSLSVTENGCVFQNITFNGTTDINVPVTVSGDYNSWIGVDFKGSLNETTGNDTAARALVLSGAQENSFFGCTFGADTFMRSAANYTVEFASAASRNVFDDCRFIMASDATTPRHIYFSEANSIDRWVEFKNCSFYNFTTNDTAQIAACMNLATQTATGHVLLAGNNMLVGIDNWESTASGRIWALSYTATANAVGQAINPTVD